MDRIGKYIFPQEFKEEDFDIIIDDREIEVDVFRISDLGNGFSSDLGTIEDVGKLKVRIDNVDRRQQHRNIKISDGDIEKNEIRFIGITRQSDFEVMVGDLWDDGEGQYQVISIIGGNYQNRIEVYLQYLHRTFII